MEEVCVLWRWIPLGDITLDEGKLHFPSATPSRPGVYRLRILGGAEDDAYIGETVNLQRRFNGYRNPGSSQRVDQKLKDYLTEGRPVVVDVSAEESAAASAGERSARPLDLAEKWNRVLLERAAEVSSRTKYKLINL